MLKRKGFMLPLISFLTLTAILVGAIGGFASFTITSQMGKEIQSSNFEKLSAVMTILERGYLVPITQLGDRIVRSNQLIYAKTSSPTSLLALNSSLKEYIIRYPYIENIGIYFTKSQILATAWDIRYNLSNSEDSKFVNELITEEELKTPKWFSRVSGRNSANSGTDVVTYTRKINNLTLSEPVIIYINMYDNSVKEVLNSASSLSAHSIFILDKNSRYISSNKKISYPFTENDFKNAVLSDKQKLSESKMVLSGCQSAETGFSYYLLAARSLFYENALKIRDMVIIICSAVALVGIVLSILLSYRNYKPLKDAAKKLGSITGENPSDEYETFEKAAKHLRRKLDNEILHQIIDGTLPYSREYEAKAILPCGYNVAAVIDTGFKEFGEVYNYCADLFSTLKNCVVLRKDLSLIVIFISFNGDFKALLPEIEKLLSEITDKFAVTSGIGSPCDSTIDLFISLKQAKNARSYHYISPDKRVFAADEVASLPHLPGYFTSAEFIKKFKSLNYDEMYGGLNELRRGLEQKIYLASDVESLLFEIISIVSSTLPAGRDKKIVLTLYSRIFEFESVFHAIDEIENKLKTFFNSTSDENVKNEMMNKIKKYIDKNYSEDLSLSFFSSKFFMAPSYISTLFKNAFGICLSDYIFDVRMEKAKEMLEDKKAKIDDVAIKCGFNNTSYFITRFKAKYGVSPNKYRTRLGLKDV